MAGGLVSDMFLTQCPSFPSPSFERTEDHDTLLDLSDYVILFDWSGTIIHDIVQTNNVFNYVLVRRGRAPVSISEFRRRFRLPYWKYLKACGLPESEAKSEQLLKEIELTYLLDTRLVVPFPETVTALSCVQSVNARLGIVSSSTRKMVETILDCFGLGHLFEVG